MKKVVLALAGGTAALCLLFLIGPRTKVEFPDTELFLPEDLDSYLTESESKFTDIIPGTEKTIFWANANKSKTPLSIVYLHGFSASRQETSPLSDNLADQLGANLFYTRLTGHGRAESAMGEALPDDWLDDAMEAIEIGQRIGERVIVIGTSTGGTLATWLAMQPQAMHIAALVLISPNFGPADKRSELITLPWGNLLLKVVVGDEYSSTPKSEDHDLYWSTSYPSAALLTMMATVKHVREADLESIFRPALFIYSPLDQVVDPAKIEDVFARFGSSEKSLHSIDEQINTGNHVLAGDILAPDNTAVLESVILEWFDSVR